MLNLDELQEDNLIGAVISYIEDLEWQYTQGLDALNDASAAFFLTMEEAEKYIQELNELLEKMTNPFTEESETKKDTKKDTEGESDEYVEMYNDLCVEDGFPVYLGDGVELYPDGSIDTV